MPDVSRLLVAEDGLFLALGRVPERGYAFAELIHVDAPVIVRVPA